MAADELAFYDALTKPRAIKDFYENDELIAITKELAETLRKDGYGLTAVIKFRVGCFVAVCHC